MTVAFGEGGCARGQMSASVRLSVTSTAAAAMVVGGIFVCSGTAPPYSLHYTVGSGCCGSGLWTGKGLAGAPSADSGLPLATGTTSGRGMVLATSLESLEGCGITDSNCPVSAVHDYWRRRCCCCTSLCSSLACDGRGGTVARLAGLPQLTVLAWASSPILATVVCWKSCIIVLDDSRVPKGCSVRAVVYWGVYAGIRRIPTSGGFLESVYSPQWS